MQTSKVSWDPFSELASWRFHRTSDFRVCCLLYLLPSSPKSKIEIVSTIYDGNIFFVSLEPVYIEFHLICAVLIRFLIFFIRLKSCEPEFLISTPERLLELVSLKAIDISNVSMLVSKCAIFVSS
jgi:hypothetical protein